MAIATDLGRTQAPLSTTLVASEDPMKLSATTLLCLTALCSLGFSCKKSEPAKAEATVAAPTAPTAPSDPVFAGTVVETMDASNYTYVRVKTDKEEIWAAASQFKVKVGDKVRVPADMPMKDFNSPTLKRTFPTIYFTARIQKEGEAPGHPSAQ